MASEADLFESQIPEITPQESLRAAKERRIVQSFHCHPVSNPDGTIHALAIKWKLGNGKTETILISRYAATVLWTLFSRLEENRWTALVTLPPDATRQ